MPNNHPLIESHILDSNGGWYSSFWLEVSKTAYIEEEKMSKNLVPMDIEARRTGDLEAWRQMTFFSEGCLNHMRKQKKPGNFCCGEFGEVGAVGEKS